MVALRCWRPLELLYPFWELCQRYFDPQPAIVLSSGADLQICSDTAEAENFIRALLIGLT